MSKDEGSTITSATAAAADNNQEANMTVDREAGDSETSETAEQAILFEEMIACVANSKAIFKSQQKNDPDLTVEEKASIASDLLHKNRSMFLSRFGRFLRGEHLRYFSEPLDRPDYEVVFHVNRLRRFHNRSQRRVDVKNRRYQALKSLIEKGEYFSETEMMRRNPLLYEHLVGQYLTEEQKKARDNIDTQNITFVNLLLESIQRDGTRNLKKEQQDAEDDVMEENDSDDDFEGAVDPEDDSEIRGDSRWGEMPGQSSNPYEKEAKEKKTESFCREISTKERQVLRDEFITNMYHSFLNGRDKDFDYSTVDDEESYDNVDLRTQDEEEKYFDSESPETIEEGKMEEGESSEDELDKYMKSLQETPTPIELADKVEKQTIH
ncbi:coiled-coil domain-containing protein 97 [Neodiprion fabricii]|uniref:coiled-coil domain-containing protein 97 n=1 Tax=Neodiprion fabricii TaxID=2872261 RepID=UPI001ED93A84|nr:coiled-coil domain-containing protein 97 [Neodiprion fabricii]